MLFHVTLGHDAQQCPGRRPTEPPGLIAPSDTRDALGSQLGVKLHFVFWSAACMLWAQPEHLAFAVLECDDVDSALQYLSALVPDNWTTRVLPVWNMPSQMRLVRQVQLAPTMIVGDTLSPMQPNGPARAEPEAAHASAEPVARPPTATDAPSAQDTWPQPESHRDEPGTITRLLHDLESPWSTSEEAENESAPPVHESGADRSAHVEQFTPPPLTQVRAYLVATSGPSRGRTFSVPFEGATVGRLPEARIYVPDERLSREHARIEFRDGTFFLSDLGSRNGTVLNGTLVSEPRPLSSGDTIELGSSTFIVSIESNAPATEE